MGSSQETIVIALLNRRNRDNAREVKETAPDSTMTIYAPGAPAIKCATHRSMRFKIYRLENVKWIGITIDRLILL